MQDIKYHTKKEKHTKKDAPFFIQNYLTSIWNNDK